MSSDGTPRLVDRRGLPASVVVSLSVVLSLTAGTIDVLTGQGLRTLFAACFVVGCFLSALLVRRDQLAVPVVAPPLLYALAALVGGAVEVSGLAGSFLTQQALELATELVTGAPVLLIGTGIAAVTAGLRWLAGRHAAATPRTAPPGRLAQR